MKVILYTIVNIIIVFYTIIYIFFLIAKHRSLFQNAINKNQRRYKFSQLRNKFICNRIKRIHALEAPWCMQTLLKWMNVEVAQKKLIEDHRTGRETYCCWIKINYCGRKNEKKKKRKIDVVCDYSLRVFVDLDLIYA